MFFGSVLPEAALCYGWPQQSLGPCPRHLRHWIALLLCSAKRPVRGGQILPRGDARTVKYLACGRNIVQQESKLRKGPRNYSRAMAAFLKVVFQRSGNL